MSSADRQGTVEGLIAFTDIVGFTELTANMGDDVALAVVTRQGELVTQALPEGARIVKELGDGLLLFFSDCARALDTCLDLQERFEKESDAFELPIWVRMGLHWGTATRYRDDLIGHDVNIASRIADVAGPGEVLVSASAVARLEGANREFEEIGPVVMKGIPEPLPLYRAVRVPAVAASD